jgi:hypothetical protein
MITRPDSTSTPLHADPTCSRAALEEAKFSRLNHLPNNSVPFPFPLSSPLREPRYPSLTAPRTPAPYCPSHMSERSAHYTRGPGIRFLDRIAHAVRRINCVTNETELGLIASTASVCMDEVSVCGFHRYPPVECTLDQSSFIVPFLFLSCLRQVVGKFRSPHIHLHPSSPTFTGNTLLVRAAGPTISIWAPQYQNDVAKDISATSAPIVTLETHASCGVHAV